MTFAVAEESEGGDLPVTPFDEDDIGVTIAVEVADAGVGGGLRNCLEGNNLKRTQAAELERLRESGLIAARRCDARAREKGLR